MFFLIILPRNIHHRVSLQYENRREYSLVEFVECHRGGGGGVIIYYYKTRFAAVMNSRLIVIIIIVIIIFTAGSGRFKINVGRAGKTTIIPSYKCKSDGVFDSSVPGKPCPGGRVGENGGNIITIIIIDEETIAGRLCGRGRRVYRSLAVFFFFVDIYIYYYRYAV